MIRELGEICTFVSGNAWKSSEYSNTGIPIIRIGNLSKDSNDFVYWDSDYDEKYIVNKGDILISLSGTIKMFKWDRGQALLNQRIVKIDATKGIDKNWVFYELKHVIKKISRLGKNAVINNVSITDLRKFEVDVPDLQTQHQIVEALDRAQSLIEKREKSIELLDELLRATFLDMFGISNPDFDSWKETKIRDLAKQEKASMRTGPFGSNLKHSEFTDSGDVAVLGIDNAVDNTFKWKESRFITLEKYEELKRYRAYPRDVIITIMGTLGRSAVIPDDIPLAISTKHLACITLDEKKCNPFYLAYSIHSNPFISFQMKSRSRGAVMDGLNLGIIKDLKLKEAPIELQNQFEQLYLSIEERKSRLKESSNKIEELFHSLLQRAFHGDLSFQSELQLDALVENKDVESISQDGSLIQELVDRFNDHKLKIKWFNEDEYMFSFKDFDEYELSKGILFQLMKMGKVEQVYNEDKKQTLLQMK